MKSKPWQCEIQVSLLMSEHLLKNHNFPGLFRYEFKRDGYFQVCEFRFTPSLRPNVHIFLEFKSSQELGSEDLLDWIGYSRHTENDVRTYKFKNGYSTQNHVHVTGQVVCKVSENLNLFDRMACKVMELSSISFCWKCPNITISIPFNQKVLSFEQLALDRSQVDRLWPGVFLCHSSGRAFGLCG